MTVRSKKGTINAMHEGAKIVAIHAGDRIGRAHGPCDAISNMREKMITRSMAERIID